MTDPSFPFNVQQTGHSCNEGRGSGGVVLERWGDLLLGLVVASETVDTGLDENETELGVLVFPVGLEVLADGDRLFDEVPKVLWDGRCQAYPQTKGIKCKLQSTIARTIDG